MSVELVQSLGFIIYPQSEEIYTVPVQPDLSKITRDVINEFN